jgi:hypothetical protein
MSEGAAMNEMTYEEKWMAVKGLIGEFDLKLCMRKPGDWYILVAHLEIGNGFTISGVDGNGATPEAAVNRLWDSLTKLKPGEFLVVDGFNNRAEFTWNGFMWQKYTRQVGV